MDKVLLTSSEDDEPMCYNDAMASCESKNWKKAMEMEIAALHENETWTIVCENMCQFNKPVIDCKWVYKKMRWVMYKNIRQDW